MDSAPTRYTPLRKIDTVVHGFNKFDPAFGISLTDLVKSKNLLNRGIFCTLSSMILVKQCHFVRKVIITNGAR